MNALRTKSTRFAETKGHKYAIMIIPVDSELSNIVETENGTVTGCHSNISNQEVNNRFDSMILDYKLYDGINHIEK